MLVDDWNLPPISPHVQALSLSSFQPNKLFDAVVRGVNDGTLLPRLGRKGLRKRYLKNDRFNAMPNTSTHTHRVTVMFLFYHRNGLSFGEFGVWSAAIFCIVFQFGWYFDWQIGACHEHNYNASEVINDIRPDSRS